MRCLHWLIFLSAIFSASFGLGVNPTLPKWQEFVVGKVSEIPNNAVRKYLEDSHFNNPYAQTIKKDLNKMGPFSPFEHNVFWVPTINVPLTPKNWRFVSKLFDAPTELRKIATVEIDGRTFLRMFLHPYSTEQRVFQELAAENGGFQYEFQGATTASVRSFVVWKTKQRSQSDQFQFPKNTANIAQAKVSIYKTDIDGSRLNHIKKMIRAAFVTRLFDSIPIQKRNEWGFSFAGEWVAAVPKGTNAGYVVRTLTNEAKGKNATRVEPAFTTLSPKRLNELTARVRGEAKFDAIIKKVFRPLNRSMTYLLMEEGMIGELHTQNFGYEINQRNALTGRVVYHDADAYRTSITLRALNNRNTAVLRNADHPFFHMKDSIFSAAQNIEGELMTLDYLLDYLTGANDSTSMVSALFKWCSAMAAVPAWCKRKKIRDRLLLEIAKELSQYLEREVDWRELSADPTKSGKGGLTKIFQERIQTLTQRLVRQRTAVDQKLLANEFKRLVAMGHGRVFSKAQTNIKYIVKADARSAYIAAVAQDGRANPLIGLALLGADHDQAAQRFLGKAGLNLNCGWLKQGLKANRDIQQKLPIYRNLGGGNNIR